jgi:serine/threonine protein kinase
MGPSEESLSDLLFVRIAEDRNQPGQEQLKSAREVQARYREAGERPSLLEICSQEGHLSAEAAREISGSLERRLAADRDSLVGKLAVKNGFASTQDIQRAADIQAGQEGKGPLGRILLDLGVLTPEQHRATLASTRRILGKRYAEGRGSADAAAGGGDASPGEERYFGNYRILEEIARGGMGIIYRAYHPGLEKEIALKTLLEGEAAGRSQIERFHREAKAAARLRHPNIVAVHDVGISEGVHFFTMDFIDGRDMDELLNDRKLSMHHAVEILAKVSRALHYAHGHAIIHRDIKPANILVDEADEPYVTDFGLAKDVSAHKKLSQEGLAIGTPEYMSPEQAEGKKKIDARSDVFSVGAVLYKALCGRPPFTAKTPMDILRKISTEDPIPPRSFRPGVPPNLETVCLKCLEKNPDRRYATAEDLAQDLERFLAGEPVLARPPSLPDLVIRRLKKHRFPLLALLAILSAVVVTAVVVSTQAKEESEHITAQLKRLRNRVSSLTRQNREDRLSLSEEIEQILKSGTAEEKRQARELLRALKREGEKKREPELEQIAARLLRKAEALLGSGPGESDEALETLRSITGFAPETPSGRKAQLLVQKLLRARSERLQERFARTVTRAGELLSLGKPGAALRAWRELLPRLSEGELAAEAVSQMHAILLREYSRFFEARAEAEAAAEEGDVGGAVEHIRPYADSDLDEVARLARLALSELERYRGPEVGVKEGPPDLEAPQDEEKKTDSVSLEILAPLANRIRTYDFESLPALRKEIASKAKGSPSEAELRKRLEDFSAVENLWDAFLRTLREGSGREVELCLREGAAGVPTRRKVKLLGLSEKGLRIRMMSAAMTIPLARVHPLSVAELGSAGLGGGKKAEYAAGVFLYCCALFDEARPRLAGVADTFTGARRFLDAMQKATARALEAEARKEFAAILGLEQEKKWPELKEAVARFRETYGKCGFFSTYGPALSRMEQVCTSLLLRCREVFCGECAPKEDGRILLSYGFQKTEDVEDWVWTRELNSYSMGEVEQGEGEILFRGACLEHAGRFSTRDFSALLRLSVPRSSGWWGLKIFNLFVKITDDGNAVHLCRNEYNAAPFHRTTLQRPEGTDVVLEVECRNLRITLGAGGKRIYRGRAAWLNEDDSLAVFADPRARIRVRSVALTGTPLPRSLDEIDASRKARQTAERLFRAVPPVALVTPSRVSGWGQRKLRSWNHRGGLSAEAVDDSIDLESVSEYEDLCLEAVLRADGRGEASIDVRNGSGQEREMTMPTGGPGKWFKVKLCTYRGFGWGRINGILARVSPPYAPVLPGPIELDVEPGSSFFIRSLKVRSLKTRHRWPSGWVRLFNGKDLEGWVPLGSRASWEVRDGLLRARRVEDRETALQSLEYLRDFDLKLEVKLEEGSAARIFFRRRSRGLFVSHIPLDGKWHRIFISARGKKIRATVDGSSVSIGNSDNDGDLNRLGSIRLEVGSGIVWFRNITVKATR